MTVPPTHYLNELGPQAQTMSRNCNNERMAMILQYVALGSMIIMAGAAASQVLKDAFGTPDRRRRRWQVQMKRPGTFSSIPRETSRSCTASEAHRPIAGRGPAATGSPAEHREPSIADGS